jgi:hypothetical protein
MILSTLQLYKNHPLCFWETNNKRAFECQPQESNRTRLHSMVVSTNSCSLFQDTITVLTRRDWGNQRKMFRISGTTTKRICCDWDNLFGNHQYNLNNMGTMIYRGNVIRKFCILTRRLYVTGNTNGNLNAEVERANRIESRPGTCYPEVWLFSVFRGKYLDSRHIGTFK